MMQLTKLNAWISLQKQVESIHQTPIPALKNLNPNRHQELIVSNRLITVDLTNQRINQPILKDLLQLAEERKLREHIQQLMQGGRVNQSENKPALHTALRQLHHEPIIVDGRNILKDIHEAREQSRLYAEKIRGGTWLGYSRKPIKDIVNIGIGGSDLGPQFCIDALKPYTASHLGYHFISDVDPLSFDSVVAALEPETTLFIISSKSFTTRETLYNTNKAIAWIGDRSRMDRHFIAVTANIPKTKTLGFSHTLPIWNWVGGRYSLCSAINLITMIAIGYEHFMDILAGAFSMDQHFLQAEWASNMPVLLALAGIWNINFLDINNLLLLTYSQRLAYFPHYIQQLDMESNGKSINQAGERVNYHTGPIVWGGLGNQAQHSYFQLLCQGTHRVAIDTLTIKENEGELINQSCDMKVTVLTQGVKSETSPHAAIPGNVPLTRITLDSCSPFAIGELIALYEHKIYTQSVIWGINPFDQPGVESAKQYCFAE
ncbi:glucose-6-phosphate isomerase [Legionella rubrilucens]|uniref:Glucose-6-phosphate isomerase n=1 Tax=Legionella rubrilucens TaxID=458 RepID=A0A0W0XS58_9GAMM|nr:glucose-6-phosphate isomerase [Legionella rubrilucens]KTD47294.1 glucose-6-phosphate isomerase [Legionella rubrilucens]